MPQRVLETLTGVGEVYANDVLLRRTRYDLKVWIDDPNDAQAGEGITHIDGHIDITGIGEAVVLAGPNQLTLRLQDGRRLHFRLTGSGGSVEGEGGLHA
jgi:hypothetical protein